MNVSGGNETTATILAHAMILEGLRNVTAGANPMKLKNGIQSATDDIVKHLKDNAVQIGDSKEKIAQVATISAQSEEVGNIIAEMMEEVGPDGVIKDCGKWAFGGSMIVRDGILHAAWTGDDGVY